MEEDDKPKRKYYPTLSEQGYIEDTRLILARILSYYMTTEIQQSFCYRQNIVSLPKAYHLGINDPNKFKETLVTDLSKLLDFHFDIYDVEADVIMNSDNVTFNILLYASVVDVGNNKHSIGNLTTYDGKVLGNLVEISNYGDGRQLLRGMFQ